MSRTVPTASMLIAVTAGGSAGALLRWSLGVAVPDDPGFPWTTLGINLVGSFLLAVLPALVAAGRRPLLALALGPGVLGGFTTLSTYADQSRALIDDGALLSAGAYLLGTLGACLLAVQLGHRLITPPERRGFDEHRSEE